MNKFDASFRYENKDKPHWMCLVQATPEKGFLCVFYGRGSSPEGALTAALAEAEAHDRVPL